MTATYMTENDSYYGSLLHIQRATGESRFPLYDEIGSARGLVDANGAVTDTYEMDTFGKPVSTTGSTPNPYRFGAAWGYMTDPSGLLQLGERFYWPEVGRFVQQDPIQDDASSYGYAWNNPLIAIDPAGLCPDHFGREYAHNVKKCRDEHQRNLPRFDPIDLEFTLGGGAVGGVVSAARGSGSAGEACWKVAVGVATAGAAYAGQHGARKWWADRKFRRCLRNARERRDLQRGRRHDRPLGWNGKRSRLLW